jgi:hypothetical protein
MIPRALVRSFRVRRYAAVAVSLPALPIFALLLAVLLPIGRAVSEGRRLGGLRPRLFWGTFAILLLKHDSAACRSVGYDSKVVILSAPPLSRREDYDYTPGADLPAFVKPLALRYAVFLWALLRFDAFQLYHTGRILHGTALEFFELQLLRLAGKRIVVSCYGSDVWLPGKTRDPNRWDDGRLTTQYRYTRDPWYRRYIERNVQYCARYADWIVVSAPFHDYLPRWDVTHHHVAVDLRQWAFVGAEPVHGPVRIVHASNHRLLKGTAELIAACERLRERGFDVDLQLVEGVPNHVARELYERADVVAAEFVMGTFGVFALEAMALGKPVLAYLRPDVYDLEPYLRDCPIVNTPIDRIEQELERLIREPNLRAQLGLAGRAFVEQYHSYASIGRFFDGIFRHIWHSADRPQAPRPLRQEIPIPAQEVRP